MPAAWLRGCFNAAAPRDGQRPDASFDRRNRRARTCRAFNSNIVRQARDHARRLQAEGKTVKIMTIGRKGADQLRRDLARAMIDHVDLRNVRQLGYVHALDIAQRVIRRFDDGEFDVATLFFSQFVNIITQKPRSMQIIPLPVPEEAGSAGGVSTIRAG